MSYQVVYDPANVVLDYSPRGACEEFIYCKLPEFIAEGPSETGKTLAACWKIHLLSIKYKGLNGAIVRKTQKSLYGSVLQTFERVIKDSPVIPYGGEKPEKYIYPNGSVIWVGGMDNADKVLSSERDFIYVNQAEELTENDWELLLTRTTGRGAVMPYTMLFGDCNPSGSKHWIKSRQSLKKIRTTHRDNPTLYDNDGNLTEQGARTMLRLESLSGVRRKRLKDGIWATAEGAVYDTFDPLVHVRVREYYEFKQFALAIDEGYTNPAVILLIGIDSDDRWHILKEWYKRNQLQSVVVSRCKSMYMAMIRYCKIKKLPCTGISTVAVDAAAAGLIADLNNAGVPAVAAKGRVLDGINHIQNRLALRGDGYPGLTTDPKNINNINEFESYVWKQLAGGISKDEPMKENDHSLDPLRYLDDTLMPIQLF